MRIAVSGTHCSGKSTLLQDFAAAHREYESVPEPYELLDEPDFRRQLELSVETFRGFAPGDCVIVERCPIDFIAYMLARRDNLGAAIDLAAEGMAHVDLLVVVSADDVEAPDDEDPELRDAMNERLLDLIATDPFDLLGNVRVLEVAGPPNRRLAMLERAVTARR